MARQKKPLAAGYHRDLGIYVTGTGQTIAGLHSDSVCAGRPCVIHAPSNHHMLDFPTHWREDRRMMERICPHGVGHPDPDDTNPNHVHGCDGCCRPGGFQNFQEVID